MADCEKVIKGLECCRNGFCFACPYNDGIDGNVDCKQKWADDAIAILKSIQPRVLTVEEVRNNCPDCVYVETKTGWLECTIQDSGESNRYCCVFVYGREKYSKKLWGGYGKRWRCWTSRPTDEQRKAVKWDG